MKLILVFLAIASGVYNNCSKHRSISEPFTVNVKNSVSLVDEKQLLKFSFDTLLLDSRCPKGVTCIWAGYAAARFSFKKDEEEYTVTLSSPKILSYVSDTVLAGYKIQLLNITPQPVADSVINYTDYKAELKITRL